MSWLITGGAGYIGSHIAHTFVLEGEEVVVLDNLSSGLIERVPRGVSFYEGDITSEDVYKKIFSQEKIQGVINLAALKSVEESMRLPDEYRRVNTHGVETALKMAIRYGVDIFLQTSTAAVYGNVDGGVAFESTNTNPISVYGSTKLDAEKLLGSCIESGKIKGTSLRYFNVVGASTRQLRDTSNSNLFPIAMNDLRAHRAPRVFGNDYQTFDGSCIRDYVHVQDVADAHLLAVRALRTNPLPGAINIGTGKGLSVFQVLEAMQTYLGTRVDVKTRPRREGDPASLVANVDLAWKQLGFRAKRTLEEMVSTTYI